MPSLQHVHDELEKNLSGIIRFILNDGLLDAVTIKEASALARKQELPFITYLVKSAILSSDAILNCMRNNLGLAAFDLKNYQPVWDSHINPEMICRYHVLPLDRDQTTLRLGMADPTDHVAISAIGFHTGLRIHPVLVAETELNQCINAHFRSKVFKNQLESTLSKITVLDPSVDPDKMEQSDEPVIEFVDHLLRHAIEKQVSDIHIEPYETSCRIRFRKDGLLHEATVIPINLAARVTMRFKILANLNIAERRQPQDGRFQYHHEMNMDIRVSTCPILFGEKLV